MHYIHHQKPYTMPRLVKIAACQVGAVHRTSLREDTLKRLLSLLESAAQQGAQIALFPELAFTTFFPRYLLTDPELDSFFEHGDITTSPQTAPLFTFAKKLGIDISIGFAEADLETRTTKLGMNGANCFNSSIYYHAKTGSILSKYRKIHLPGDFEPFEDHRVRA